VLFFLILLLWPGSTKEPLQTLVQRCSDEQTVPDIIFSIEEIDTSQIKTLVLVDVRARARVKHAEKLISEADSLGIKILIYDHHPPSNDDVPGEMHYVECGAASSIMVTQLQETKTEISPQQATWIGMGIYEDTGCFVYDSTQVLDFEAAVWLKKKGMESKTIYDYLHKHSATGIALTQDQLAVYEELTETAKTYVIMDKKKLQLLRQLLRKN